MHLIKDENGNLIPHGGHDHAHEHEHTHEDGTVHSHPHTHAHDHEEDHHHSHEHPHDHEHTHGHEHPHDDAQHCGACNKAGDCNKETVALLNYMYQHNEAHAKELDQMADNLEKLGMLTAAKTIRDGVADFQKGNMRLALALSLVRQELGC